MNKTNTFIVILLLIISCYFGFRFFTGYRSAFEADQACHYELQLKSENVIKYGCDHDLETRQWILFESNSNKLPSIVIKRFHY